jgi:mono/diheme cytochrome c family protein
MLSRSAIVSVGCCMLEAVACSPHDSSGEGPRLSSPNDAGAMDGRPAPGAANTPSAIDSPTNEGNPTAINAIGAAGIAAGDVPCDVAAIVAEHCATCHGATPKFNAPMSLTSAEDFGATAPLSGGPVRAAASRRINAEGGARMPPPGTVEALDPRELATLSAWLDAGAPVAGDGCAIGTGEAPPAGGTALLPRPDRTGTLLGPYEGWDENIECYPFTTYDPNDPAAPYPVGIAQDKYIGFGFQPPWQGTRYVRAFRTRIDNAQALHHWILYEEPGATSGSVSEIVGAHPDGQMLHGWAPGGDDLYFSPDVGIRMESSTGYLLEVHYNSSDASARDASGLEICVTSEPPTHEAIVSWLGTDRINGTSASGTCRPRAAEPLHIIAATPHMHLKGKAMKVSIERADGATDVVHDEAFSFQNQRAYPEDITIEPGDSITTTCTYSAPASFGRGTNQEMCYWFALAYPAGALADGALLGTLTHGSNACLGL